MHCNVWDKVCCNSQKFHFSFIRCLRTWVGEEVQNHNQPPKLLNSMAIPVSAILTQNTHFWQQLSTGNLDDHHLFEGTIWAIIFVLLVIFLLVYSDPIYTWVGFVFMFGWVGWHTGCAFLLLRSSPTQAWSSSAHFSTLSCRLVCSTTCFQTHVHIYPITRSFPNSLLAICHSIGAFVIITEPPHKLWSSASDANCTNTNTGTFTNTNTKITKQKQVQWQKFMCQWSIFISQWYMSCTFQTFTWLVFSSSFLFATNIHTVAKDEVKKAPRAASYKL